MYVYIHVHVVCMYMYMYMHIMLVAVVLQNRAFVSGSEREYKLVDVTDFSLYWDTEVVGGVEGDELVVRQGGKEGV